MRLALVFLVLAIAGGALGFGGWAGPFTSLSIASFYVFAALTILSLLAMLVAAAHWRTGGAFAALLFAGLIGAGVYAGSRVNMPPRALEALDGGAAQVTADAERAFHGAGAKVRDFAGGVGEAAKRPTGGQEEN